jgi:hypothetical protein
VTYLYADRAPAATTQPLPPASERMVANPRRALFTPGATMPIESFSRRNATLTKRSEKFGDHSVEVLSLKANVKDLKGGSQFVTLLCDLPEAGRYRVSIAPIKGPEAPIVQLIENELPLGEQTDLYAAQRAPAEPIAMGEAKLKAGRNQLQIRLVGKNEAATGFQLDLVQVICERVD